MQCSAVHYTAVQFSAVQCSAVQCSVVECSVLRLDFLNEFSGAGVESSGATRLLKL